MLLATPPTFVVLSEAPTARASLLLLCLIWTVSGPSLRAQPASLRFTHLTLADGLPHTQVRDVLQDRQGFMWFATAGGLARYDGYRVVVFRYDPDDPRSLSDNNVWALCEDRRGTLWVGTQGGLNRFDPATQAFTRYENDPADPGSLAHSAVRSIYEDRAGRLWVGTYGSALSRYEPEADAFTRFTVDARPPGFGLNGLYEAPSEPGVLWLTSWGGGLGRFDTRTETLTLFRHDPANPRSLSTDLTLAAFEDREGRLWVGTEGGGLERFDRRTGTFTHYRHGPDDPASLGNDTVWDVYQPADDPGGLWLATDGAGLVRLDLETGAFTPYRHDPHDPYSLVHDQPKALFEDAGGVLWVATLGGGVSRTVRQPSPFRHFTQLADEPNSLSHPSVTGVVEMEDGVLWMATEYGGLNRFDPGTGAFTHYRHDRRDPTTLRSDEVFSLLHDRAGNLWVGFWGGGLDRFDPAAGTFTRVAIDALEVAGRNEVWVLRQDREGVLWIGLFNGGLVRYDPRTGTSRHYTHDPGDLASLSHNRVLTILEDRQGTLWVGTGGGGLNRFDRRTQTFTAYRHDPADPASLSGNTVSALEEDAAGGLWVGTGGGGLNRFDPGAGTFTRITEQNSDLPNNNIGGLLVDRRGDVWLGTDAGLTHFDPDRHRFTTFTGADGLEHQELRIAYVGPSGTFYFGGRRGLDAFIPERLPAAPNPTPPPVAVTAIRVGDRPVPPSAALVLPPAERDVAFTFAALHYADPERNQYRYRLEGYDDAWHVPGPARTASYTNLDPGTYTFRVQAANSDGVWNEAGTSVAVRIAPFFYETWWFAALCLAGALLLLFAGYRYRVRQLRRREHDLESQVAERTQALRREKRTTEEQAERLREMDRLKSRFFTNVSHEFRTPLTLTIGPLEDLAGDAGLSAPARRSVDLALRNARRLLRLINQLLDIARLEAGELRLQARRQDLGAFLHGLALSFAPLAERRSVSFDVETPEEPVWAYADADQLEQIVVNLLSNAFKFTPEGGAIRVWLATDEAKGQVRLAVRDSGPGIPAADLPHLFDRFYQVRESASTLQHGSGIGLSLAKDLAELHGGTLAVESTEGFGATFTLTLPQGRDHLPDEALADPGERRLAPRTGDVDVHLPMAPHGPEAADDEDDRTTVLVVDDNADIRRYVRSHLDGRYRVLEAPDGEQALRVARRELPDLILSDVMMPAMDGLELLRALRADRETRFLPVILLTAKAAVENRIEGLEEGADDYLTKPFSVPELRTRVDNLIASRRRLREQFDFRTDAAPALPASGNGLPGSDAAFLAQVRAAVMARLDDADFTVEQLAAEVGQSRSSLHRRLRQLAGETPTDHVRHLRLEQAAALLAAHGATVGEVAYAVGFRSVSHFSQCFRRRYGLTPTEYADQSTLQA